MGPESPRGRRAAPADDTPTLLRWSRMPPAPAAASLQTIPLQGLATLPPPPPATLPAGALTIAPAASLRAPTALPRKSPPVSQAVGLPPQPGEAFRLARLVAQEPRPKDPSIALVAVQRRQWWLLPGQHKALQILWASGLEQASPAGLGTVPEGVAIRKAAVAAAAPLALKELHGTSLLDGDQLWLLWRQGTNLWILRSPLESISEP
ncbi:MAG: hypothetical protein WD136_02670 [Cyanobium sp.]